MSTNKKYPQSFYDDGLGDILEWIDDEVLVSGREIKASAGVKRSNKNKAKNIEIDRDVSKGKNKPKKLKIYGDNDIDQKLNDSSARRVKSDLIKVDEDEVDQDGNTVDVDTKKLDDRIRGLVNRLAAQTMPFVTSEFEKIYSTNSRTVVTNSIFKNIESSIISKHSLTKRKLVAELMLLVSYLSGKINHSIGASIVHKLIVKFENYYGSGTSDGDKRLDNIVCCIVNLYMIGLVGCNVIFELTDRVCRSDDFRQKSVELLLGIVESIGFQLRKDNPTRTRQLILNAHENCNTLKSDSNELTGARLDFMIETLSAIKNNNVNKIGNYGCNIDKETIESTLKGLIQRTKFPEALSDATYEEILNSANWYVLETRVDQIGEGGGKNSAADQAVIETNSKSERKICKALGLNKPTERTIFSALLKVSDYVEASNIVIGFGLNYCSDAMIVSIHVAIHEKKYNQFYFDLINNLCKFNRKYKMAAKFAIQDKIRVLNEMPAPRVEMFKRLCFELIQSDAIPITILKAIEWANLNDSTKVYLSFLLESISALPEGEKKKIMMKVDKKGSFAGAIRTFSHCFLRNCLLFD